jgi:hypothetical protein
MTLRLEVGGWSGNEEEEEQWQAYANVWFIAPTHTSCSLILSAHITCLLACLPSTLLRVLSLSLCAMAVHFVDPPRAHHDIHVANSHYPSLIFARMLPSIHLFKSNSVASLAIGQGLTSITRH